MTYSLKPPAGMDPTYDWDSYASRLASESDTDKKRTAAAVAGIALITKGIFDDELTKSTTNKLAAIEADKAVTDSLITKRFIERKSLIDDIKAKHGTVSYSKDDKGEISLVIGDKEKIKNTFRREELLLAQENLPLANFAKERKLNERSRAEAIARADHAAEKFLAKPMLYDWSKRTQAEAQDQVNKLYRGAAGSLNKKRYNEIIAKKFTQMTGTYVDDPEQAYLAEVKQSFKDMYSTKDSEYSKLVSSTDIKAQENLDRQDAEVIKTLTSAKKELNPKEDAGLLRKIDNRISILKAPVESLKPSPEMINLILESAGSGVYGQKAFDDPQQFIQQFTENYKKYSLLNGNNTEDTLYLISLPSDTTNSFKTFHSAEDASSIIIESQVKAFIKREEANPTYIVPSVQNVYKEHTIKQLKHVNVNGVGNNGQPIITRTALDKQTLAVYETEMFAAQKEPLIVELKKLRAAQTSNMTAKEKKDNAINIANTEEQVKTLTTLYSNVNSGNMFTIFTGLKTKKEMELIKYTADSYRGGSSSDAVENNGALIKKALYYFLKDISDDPSNTDVRRKEAKAMIDTGEYKSTSTIATIQTLQVVTGLFENSGSVGAEWFRDQALDVPNILYEVALKLDIAQDIPSSESWKD